MGRERSKSALGVVEPKDVWSAFGGKVVKKVRGKVAYGLLELVLDEYESSE